jgi:hypothetical protein
MTLPAASSDCRFCLLTPAVVDDQIESRLGKSHRSGAANSRGAPVTKATFLFCTMYFS